MNISVCIPLYNKEKYIKRAIESVLAQSKPADEIIIVDDGSTDESTKVVLGFNDDRIRLIQQKNSGEGATRNRAMKEAKNELLALLDADDEWKPDFLASIQNLVEMFPNCAAYASNYDIVFPTKITSVVHRSLPPHPWKGVITNYFYHAQSGHPFNSSSIVLKKQVVEKLNGFPEGVNMSADTLFWIKLGMKYKIAYSSSPQSIYHQDIPDSAVKKTVSPYPITAKYIEDALLSNEVPKPLINDLTDYIAYLKIQRSYHLIITSRGVEAQNLLRSIGKNKKYKYKILFWRFWSLLPFEIFDLLHLLKYKLPWVTR
jgi:glycosyltransferase involved in cell wall biosynthesis